jgi:hypothetical protein
MSKARALKKKYRGGGGSNELEDLVFRLSLELPIHESINIVQQLNVSDMSSFKSKIAKYGDINKLKLEKIEDIEKEITMEGDANRILSVILNMIKEINEDEQILMHHLEGTFIGNGINTNYNASYITYIIQTLRFNNIYDLIDATPKDIKDISEQELPQIYKDKLLALRKSLKTTNKIYTLLMKDKNLTQHEAIYVSKILGILNPKDFKYFTKKDIDDNINKLTTEKKEKLWILIKDLQQSGKKKISQSSN